MTKILFKILDALMKEREDSLRASEKSPIREYQIKAMENYRKLPLLDARAKQWQKMPLNELENMTLRMAQEPQVQHLIGKKAPENLLGLQKASGAVGISERSCQSWLDETLQQKGVVLCDLDTAFKQHPELALQALDTRSEMDNVAAFSAATSRHGFLLYIPARVQIVDPLVISIHLEEGNTVMPVLGMVLLEAGSLAKVITSVDSDLPVGSMSIFPADMAIRVGDNASLRFVEVQKTEMKVWNFLHEDIRLGQQANLERFLVDSGGKVTKRYFSAGLEKEGSQATITGVYTPRENQVFIYDTHQDHLASHTQSNLMFRGVLDQAAYSLWKGNVVVAEGTHGADGFQVNNNLMLAESAQAESIPGLEIKTDDVRCSHAVTISSLDDDQVFYLQSRGINPGDAEKLIVGGFLQSAALRIEDAILAETVQKELENR